MPLETRGSGLKSEVKASGGEERRGEIIIIRQVQKEARRGFMFVRSEHSSPVTVGASDT